MPPHVLRSSSVRSHFGSSLRPFRIRSCLESLPPEGGGRCVRTSEPRGRAGRRADVAVGRRQEALRTGGADVASPPIGPRGRSATSAALARPPRSGCSGLAAPLSSAHPPRSGCSSLTAPLSSAQPRGRAAPAYVRNRPLVLRSSSAVGLLQPDRPIVLRSSLTAPSPRSGCCSLTAPSSAAPP